MRLFTIIIFFASLPNSECKSESFNNFLLPEKAELFNESREWLKDRNCPKGKYLDLETLKCATANRIYLKEDDEIFEFCSQKYSAKMCSTEGIDKKSFIRLQDEFILSISNYQDWLKLVRSRKDIYNTPFSQDLEGRGVDFDSNNFCANYSEEYPFILSPRRQTNSMVKQLYTALPPETQNTVAFVITDRLIQCPEKYINYLKTKKELVIIGSFHGSGTLKEFKNSTFYELVLTHEKELFKLKATLGLAKILKLKVKNILYAMGDSSTPLGTSLKARLLVRYRDLMKISNYRGPQDPLSWGADELAALAFASCLPSQKAYIEISRPEAKQFMDGMDTADELVELKLQEANLQRTNNIKNADLIFYIFTRRASGHLDDYDPKDFLQSSWDHIFKDKIKNQPEEYFPKTTIIDARLFNGAWDTSSVLKRCDYLAYSAWGTFSNSVGSGFAVAKILRETKDKQLEHKMLLEAIFHDVFCNGYATVQRGEFPKKLFNETGIKFSHFDGYYDYDSTIKVFNQLNEYANERFQDFFANSTCQLSTKYAAKPKLWRTFESDIESE